MVGTMAKIDNSVKKKVPELRFKGFTDEWEERKLGDIAPLRGGFAFKSSKFRNTGVPIVRISNILSSGEVGGDFVYYDEQDKDDKYILPDKSAVLAMSGATTGKVSILSLTDYDKVYQNQRVGYFQSVDDIDYGFISTIVRSELFMTQLESVLVSGAQPNVSSKEIDSFNFMIPILVQEQQKIGVFFKKLDEIIALHQRKLDLLKEQKKGYLQKMFPKNGAKVPELRFAGFADDWEERKLGDIFKKDTQKNKDLEFHSDSVISVAKMKLSPPSAKSSDEYMKTYNKIRKGNVAFEGHTNDEFPNGRFVLNDCQDGIVSHIYDVYSAVDEYNNEFMKCYINNPDVMRKILINATSSARMMKSLNSIEFLKQSILLPILSEQQKIGKFFKQLDDTIALHQRKLDLLKEQKKGFLQKMFV